MSTIQNASLAAGLAALGCLALSVAGAVADGPPAPTVLLLADGQVVKGTILEADDGYVVRTPIGQKLYPRRIVEKVFGSIEEIYAYKLERLPGRDADERLKLARWCLAQNMLPESKEHLEAILAADPEHRQAKTMLFQINATLTGRAPMTDPAVQRAGGERIEPPASLSLNALRDAARTTKSIGPPVVFDLPPPLAIKRYNEFQTVIHGELQRKCAACHNEQSRGTFQLVQAQSVRDLNNELLVRANLDATLRLVNPQDPARSRLLSAAIMPHKPDDRPILFGPNHPTYRQLAYWVSGLRSPTATRPAAAAPPQGDSVAPVVYQAPAPRPNSGFAADRRGARSATPAAPVTAPALMPAAPLDSIAPPPLPANIHAPNSVRLDSGETVPFEPTPAGQILPGSTVGMPKSPPASVPPALRLPAARPTGPASPATEKAPPKTIRVPGIGEVEVVDLDAPPEKPKDAAPKASKKDGINKDALQKFMTGGRK